MKEEERREGGWTRRKLNSEKAILLGNKSTQKNQKAGVVLT